MADYNLNNFLDHHIYLSCLSIDLSTLRWVQAFHDISTLIREVYERKKSVSSSSPGADTKPRTPSINDLNFLSLLKFLSDKDCKNILELYHRRHVLNGTAAAAASSASSSSSVATTPAIKREKFA